MKRFARVAAVCLVAILGVGAVSAQAQVAPPPEPKMYAEITFGPTLGHKSDKFVGGEAGIRVLEGVDVFVESDLTPLALGRKLEKLVEGLPLKLALVSNRGVKVYPVDASAETDVVDCWCARFRPTGGVALNDDTISVLLSRISAVMPWMHVEKLAAFDGTASYSKAAGEE